MARGLACPDALISLDQRLAFYIPASLRVDYELETPAEQLQKPSDTSPVSSWISLGGFWFTQWWPVESVY